MRSRGYVAPAGYVFEVDSGRDHATNADDPMTGVNGQDRQRAVSLSTFRKIGGTGASQYPSFAFIGGGNKIRIYYDLSTVE